MSEQADPGRGSPQAGVLGNLPHSRPSVRSPKRDSQPPKRGPKPTAETKHPREESQAAPDHGSAADGKPPAEQPADLEALARGGLAVAGEAASLGLRLAGRAAAAVRDAVERR